MSVCVYIARSYTRDLKINNEHSAETQVPVYYAYAENQFPDFNASTSETFKNLSTKLDLMTNAEYRNLGLCINADSNRLKVCIKGPFFKHLRKTMEKSFKVRLILNEFTEKKFIPAHWHRGTFREKRLKSERTDEDLQITTIEMEPRICANSGDILFEDAFPLESCQPFGKPWSTSKSKSYTVRVTMMALFNCENENAAIENCLVQPSIPNLRDYTRKLLSDKVGTDVTIICGNQAEVPCHKLFLIANSPVFRTMLQEQKYKEGETSRIEIPDMSELGINALLGYLYSLDVAPAVEDFEIAMEMLEASEKYSIESLKAAMKKIFFGMSDDWYPKTREGVFQLFVFAKNASDCADLKEKAVGILKSKPENSTEFTEFLSKHPAAAVELCTALLKAEANKPVKNEEESYSDWSDDITSAY